MIKLIRKISTKIAAGALIMALLGPFLALHTASAQKEHSFVVKLNSQAEVGHLLAAASSARQLFKFASSPEFDNIFAFKSWHSKSSLERMLAGKFQYLEHNGLVRTSGLTVTDVFLNDPGFTLKPENIDKQWGIPRTRINEVWEKTTGSKGNVAAVIDTGIDATHEDLQSINFVTGFDFIRRQIINGNINSDDNGHGTLVAGVLGATANNGMGIAGSNWQISIMPIKALNAEGKGESSTISEAIVWAADNGAGFINLSIGGAGFGHDTTLASAIAYAFSKNAVIVAAAGNDSAAIGTNLDEEPVYPICDDNDSNMVIGVAATDHNDLKPGFSNYGKACIDVTAPGKRILSTINFDPLTNKPSPDSYAYASGTSLAVPFVVGQAALIKSVYPHATNEQIRDRIISTADRIDNLNLVQCGGGSCIGLLGSGRINALRSVESGIAQAWSDGELVRVGSAGPVYQILGGQKRLVSSFVMNQKFAGITPRQISEQQASNFPDGPYVTPKDGTLVKLDASPTVFLVAKGKKWPVTQQVFQERRFSFLNVHTLDYPEINSWVTGNFLTPPDGTLVKARNNKTVYWVVEEALHPVNFEFYKHRGLDIFPILTVPDGDIGGFSVGEAYIR